MKQRVNITIFCLGLMIALIFFVSLTPRHALAESKRQSGACNEMLINAAGQATVNGNATFADVIGDAFSCSVYYEEPDAPIVTNLSITETNLRPDPVYQCNSDETCKLITFHGYPAELFIWESNQTYHIYWYVERGTVAYEMYVEERGSEDYMPVAEALWSATEGKLPGAEVSFSEPAQSNSDCAGVTPEKLRAGGVAVLACRLHCDPNIMSDDELWACINQYSSLPGEDTPAIPNEQPGGDTPIIPGEDPLGSDQPASLGPLATTPLVPLAGALIGTLLGWIVSVAATSGNALKTLAAPPLKVAPPPKVPTDSAKVQPPVTPVDAPKSGAEQLWDITTNLIGSSSTVVGSLSEFFDFKEDTETLQKLNTSLQVWQNNPTKELADEYLKNLRNTTNVGLSNAGKVLGNVANVLDVADGVAKGLDKASKRGFTGDDKVLSVGAEFSKKALNYALTKNPVVGLANAALGGFTEMTYGEDGRIDIGSVIDTGADAWDNTTQEYAGYTGGDWLAPKNKDFGNVLANDPELRRKDQYLHGLRQIKKMVTQGKISLQEGGARIRLLRDTMLGGE